MPSSRQPARPTRRFAERSSAWGRRCQGSCSARTRPRRKITAQSRSEAEDRLETARREAAEIVSGAEQRVRELDAETDRIWAERHRIVEDTRELARELLAITDSAAGRFPAEAVPLEGADEAPALGSAALGSAAAVVPADTEADSGADDVDPEDIFADEHDPDVEATAVLPVVEPADHAPADHEPGHHEPGDDDPGHHEPGDDDPGRYEPADDDPADDESKPETESR